MAPLKRKLSLCIQLPLPLHDSKAHSTSRCAVPEGKAAQTPGARLLLFIGDVDFGVQLRVARDGGRIEALVHVFERRLYLLNVRLGVLDPLPPAHARTCICHASTGAWLAARLDAGTAVWQCTVYCRHKRQAGAGWLRVQSWTDKSTQSMHSLLRVRLRVLHPPTPAALCEICR